MAASSSSSSSSSFFEIKPLDSCCEIYCHAMAMDACCLCGRRLSGDRDIYMYRGDMPFCSEECRCQQILRDEQASSKNSKSFKEHLASEEQQHHRHETPAAAESGSVKLAADVSVAT